jgi:predicted metal-dependent HD superfamily phosphohydrolase
MKERFVKLWSDINAKGKGEDEFNKLVELYSSENRFYHNLNHIENCLKEIDSVPYIVDKKVIEFAIWYHDAIYDVKEKNNEEKSAQFAYNISLRAKSSEIFSDKVYDLILATKHQSIYPDIHEQIMVDVDLSIFGKSKEEFYLYEQNIRKEYFFVPIEQYKIGRKKILKMFLDKDSIYQTDFFKQKYEKQARFNLCDSISNLE